MGVRRQYDKFVSNFLSSNDERPEEAIEGSQIDSDSNESKQLEQLHQSAGVTQGDIMHAKSDSSNEGGDHTDSILTSPTEEEVPQAGSGLNSGSDLALRERVISALKEVYDPEIPVNIYDLGLIYRIEVDLENKTSIDMTLTSPNCPVAESLPQEVENAARSAEGVSDVIVEVVWDPPWDMDRMGEAAKLELGLL